MQTVKEKTAQSVEVVKIMEDFLEEVTLKMSLNKRIFKKRRSGKGGF